VPEGWVALEYRHNAFLSFHIRKQFNVPLQIELELTEYGIISRTVIGLEVVDARLIDIVKVIQPGLLRIFIIARFKQPAHKIGDRLAIFFSDWLLLQPQLIVMMFNVDRLVEVLLELFARLIHCALIVHLLFLKILKAHKFFLRSL